MKKILLSLTAMAASVALMATNPVVTAMPSLSIAPDAHAAGMGDIGVATTPDMNSQHWNPAKYAFFDERGGISASYTPWLTKLVTDIDLAYLSGFYKFDELQAISASFTYFSMGEVQLTDDAGQFFAMASPNEWALDVAYSRKLHEYVSMAATLRFMYSDLNNGNNGYGADGKELYPAWTMAADISLFYRQPIELPMGTSYFGLGFNLSNLGGKMSYDKGDTQNFIPANMRIGASFELPFDNYNRLQFAIEADKTLVPTTYSKYGNTVDGSKSSAEYPDGLPQFDNYGYSKLSSPNGWWQSFCDAPGYTTDEGKVVSAGMEEFQEVRWGAGIEYSYNRQFFARLGYSHENYFKGNRRYVTFGAGFKLSIVRLDVSYCLATAPSNPLDGTMRFTLGFDLAGIKDLVNNRK